MKILQYTVYLSVDTQTQISWLIYREMVCLHKKADFFNDLWENLQISHKHLNLSAMQIQ